MASTIDEFRREGFVHLRSQIDSDGLRGLRSECDILVRRGLEILAQTEGVVDWATYYRAHPGELIVVPELGTQRQICRLEYLAGASRYLREVWIPGLAQLAGELLGRPVVLFKDKCNMKHPGGGAFTAHQDIAAYRHFAASYHLTAAVILEAATRQNGCLQIAGGYRELEGSFETRDTPLGRLPIFPTGVGEANGDIQPEIVQRLDWRVLESSPGDVILFDSYVPHRSSRNDSPASRKIMFFTFNLLSDGDHYEAYYRSKREDMDNPIFHVSTPTLHRDRAS